MGVIGCWEKDNRNKALESSHFIKGPCCQLDLPLLMLTLSPGQGCVYCFWSVKLLFPSPIFRLFSGSKLSGTAHSWGRMRKRALLPWFRGIIYISYLELSNFLSKSLPSKRQRVLAVFPLHHTGMASLTTCQLLWRRVCYLAPVWALKTRMMVLLKW